jgi:threonylcarbamoyladenosine tRNA methylthiotransferase MtaB
MRIAITTLGCKVNQYDSAALETRLRDEGCTVVPFGAGADVYVVNSCSVTDRADAESRQLARRARRFNAAARVVLTGCWAQTDAAGAAIAEVDHVVGLNRLDDLVRAVRGEIADDRRILVDDLRTARNVRTIGAEVFAGQTRAFLKVQEGCDLFCTFCIVPFARGRSRSVAPRQVLEQLQKLSGLGFREVVLTGVHLGGYGEDLHPRRDLCDLIEMLVERAPVARIRLSSIDPPEVTARLIDLLAVSNVLCPHLHIPMQAGDDAVLRRMRRKYDVAFLDDVTNEIRRRLPDAAIGTDVIAGFPGETEREADATVGVIERLPFTYLHVFPYSKRSGTTAAKLRGHLPPVVVKARAQHLRELGEKKRAAFGRSFVGRTLQVLVEGAREGKPALTGYSRNYQRVDFEGAPSFSNREVRVRAVGWDRGRLFGRLEKAGE